MELKKWLLSGLALLLCRPLFAEVRGQVSDVSQNPIPGAHVTLTNVAKPELRFEFDTDERGVFTTDTIPNGVYWLETSGEGFQPNHRITCDIHFPRGLNIGITLFRPDEAGPPQVTDAEVWGELSDSSGPLAKAKVCLSAEGKGGNKQSCTVTNRLGQYSLSVAPGVYRGSVIVDNEVTWEGRLALSQCREYPDPITLE
jgi:hypothetical protein